MRTRGRKASSVHGSINKFHVARSMPPRKVKTAVSQPPHKWTVFVTDNERIIHKINIRCAYEDGWENKNNDDQIGKTDICQEMVTTIADLKTQLNCTVETRLSRANFADIYLAYSICFNTNVAVKVARFDVTFSSDSIIEEQKILSKISHPNIIKLLSSNMAAGLPCLVLEYCSGGDLYRLLHQKSPFLLAEPVSHRYFMQLLDAVEYLHNNQIYHCDIKCKNILLDGNNGVKLCDFGMALIMDQPGSRCIGMRGTPGYRLPEMVSEMEYDPGSADLWAMGVVLYIMSVGRLPYGDKPEMRGDSNMYVLQFPPSNILPLSESLKTLLKGILNYLSHARYSLNRIKQAAWCQKKPENIPMIGNHYLSRRLQKFSTSPDEAIERNIYQI